MRLSLPNLSPLLLLGLLMVWGCADAPEAPAPVAPSPASLAFVDVTEAAGLGAFRHQTGAQGDFWFPEAMGSGGGFVDVDGDGWLDVLLLGGGTWGEAAGQTVWAYRNDGTGQFADATAAWGLDAIDAYTLGLTAADYDNDGDADLFITTLGADLFFRNEAASGTPRFVEATDAVGLTHPPGWSASALFFDADRDGALDLYVGNYVDWTPETDLFCSTDGTQKSYCTPELYEGLPGVFYHNQGDGTFREATEEAGLQVAHGKTLGVTAVDYDRDGDPDLILANDTAPDQLFRNHGDGTFEEVGVVSGIAFDERGRARAGMGLDVGVVDATGEPTFFVGNFSNQMIGVYRHLGRGVFLDRAAASKIGRPSLLTLTFGLFLFDADLDGWLDLFAANGHVQPDIEKVRDNEFYRQPAHLFLNQHDGTFADAAPALGAPLMHRLVARGAAYGDYDRDGDLDILLTENDGPAHLWRNDVADARSLRVHLTGTASNRDGLGAEVEVVAGGPRQYRTVRTGSSYLSQSEIPVTFGLGAAQRADSLIVRWPSGQVSRFANVAAGALHVHETDGLQEEPMP